MRIAAIVNPNSAGRRTGGQWSGIAARLERALGPVDAHFTEAPLDAMRLARQALERGAELVIAVGGDGTVNETVNGFFDGGAPVRPGAQLGLLTCGTGGDFRRSFELPLDVDAQIARLAAGRARPVDLGRLACATAAGGVCVRYFDNICSFGLSGQTCATVNALRHAKRLGGGPAFYYATVKTLMTYTPKEVVLRIDGGPEQTLPITVVAVCNGQYFGAGMRIAPMADPGDGLLEIIAIRGGSRLGLLRRLGAVYRGAHLAYPEVTALRGTRIEARPAPGEPAPVLIDLDGETPGQLPLTIETVPAALLLRC